MTLANKITILRIVLIPVFIILFLQRVYPWPAIIFTATMITDALDGFIARRRKQTTPLGAFLDPLADKLLMLSSFLTAVYLQVIPLWIFVIILSRDLLIVLGWVIGYFITNSTEIQPRLLGKLTTVLQMLTVWVILLEAPAGAVQRLMIAMVIVTALSGIDYVITGSKKLNAHA